MLNNKMAESLGALYISAFLLKCIIIEKTCVAVFNKIGFICNKKNIEKEKTETLCKAIA